MCDLWQFLLACLCKGHFSLECIDSWLQALCSSSLASAIWPRLCLLNQIPNIACSKVSAVTVSDGWLGNQPSMFAKSLDVWWYFPRISSDSLIGNGVGLLLLSGKKWEVNKMFVCLCANVVLFITRFVVVAMGLACCRALCGSHSIARIPSQAISHGHLTIIYFAQCLISIWDWYQPMQGDG